MPLEGITLQQVESPSDARIAEAVALFVELMHDDKSMISLTGGAPELVGPLGSAMLRAGAQYGEYYEAVDAHGRLVGFLMTMPPGQDLFSTDEQRALGLTDFMGKLPEAGKEYYRTTYMIEFPAVVNRNLGPTGKRDSWYIHMLMVKREHQGRGIGKGLIGLVREKAAKNGDRIAMSCTTDTNAIIYQRCGLTLRDKQMMPSPWGEWPLYLLALDTTT